MNQKIYLLVLASFIILSQSANYFCSGFCQDTGCNGFTANNCNSKCSANWQPAAATCELKPNNGRQLIDYSEDAGGMMTVSPYLLNSSCSGMSGISYYGEYKPVDKPILTLSGGTDIYHYAL